VTTDNAPAGRKLAGRLREALSGFLAKFSRRTKAAALAFVLFFTAGFWSADMARVHMIDDNPNLAAEVPVAAPGGRPGSAAVAIAAALIHQQVDLHPWVANKPFFMPSSHLDNMSNYQQGVIYALGRFAVELSDQIGRSRGSSQVDPDLDRAVGLLKYPGNIWVYDPKNSLAPTSPSETQYRRAREALLSYNTRLSQGKAVFDPRSDNLAHTMDYIAADLGSQSAVIENHLKEKRFWLTDDVCDDIFYATKGRLYAYYLVLREMKKDYAAVIQERNLEKVWDNMLENFQEAIELRPLVVISGPPDSEVLPSHLAAQGFFLLRARTNLREITGILSR
jgi:hypothetical protein